MTHHDWMLKDNWQVSNIINWCSNQCCQEMGNNGLSAFINCWYELSNKLSAIRVGLNWADDLREDVVNNSQSMKYAALTRVIEHKTAKTAINSICQSCSILWISFLNKKKQNHLSLLIFNLPLNFHVFHYVMKSYLQIKGFLLSLYASSDCNVEVELFLLIPLILRYTVP